MTDAITLPRAVCIVLEGFTLPDAARKILETAYWADAALAQQAEQVWHPISTAPKAGQWALVYADEAINCAFVKQGELPKDWCGATMWNITPTQVTHWMPLPDSPKEIK